jgi:hypothetical protein
MKKIFLLMVLFIVFFSCNTFSYKNIKIDISKINNEIRIKDENKKNVYQLYCKINGEVKNIVEMEFTDNEGTVSYKIIPENGKINFIYNTDWYSNELVIKIISYNIPGGNINIIYKFIDSTVYAKVSGNSK